MCPLELYMGNTNISHVASFGFVWKYKYFARGYLWELHQHACISKGTYPLGLYGTIHILQWGTLRICMKIHVFPMWCPLEM